MRCPGVILIKCPNHPKSLLLMWRSSRSTPGTPQPFSKGEPSHRRKLISPTCTCDVVLSGSAQLVTTGEGRNVDQLLLPHNRFNRTSNKNQFYCCKNVSTKQALIRTWFEDTKHLYPGFVSWWSGYEDSSTWSIMLLWLRLIWEKQKLKNWRKKVFKK